MHRPHTDPSTLHRLVPILFKNLHPKMNASSKRNMLKVLRLVSKDVGSLALSVMHRCEVYIGETEGFFPISPQPEMAAVKTTASPDPQQLSKLMAGNHLRELKVFIIVKTGVWYCDETLTHTMFARTSHGYASNKRQCECLYIYVVICLPQAYHEWLVSMRFSPAIIHQQRN